jgi:hypothetical protein
MNKLELPLHLSHCKRIQTPTYQLSHKLHLTNSKAEYPVIHVKMSRYQTIASKIPRLNSFYTRPFLSSSTITTRHLGRALYSTQGYGDGKGDPAGENPTEQGVSQRTRELEHPGPEQSKKKSSSDSSQKRGASGTSKKGSERSPDIPARSAKEGLENEIARGRGQ